MVPLKACLDAICRSSPELVQDLSRDFSVYVLDPLESNTAPAPVNISNNAFDSQTSKESTSNAEHSRGVAVGLGLMSWALLADEKDSVAVTGTLIKLATGQEALEVIFALRETVTMQQALLPLALRSWGLPPKPRSKSTRVHASKLHETKHPLRSSTSNNDRSITSCSTSDDFQNSAMYSRHSSQSEMPKSSDPSSSASTPSPPYSAQHDTHVTDVTTLATIASIQMRSQIRAKAKIKKPPKPPPFLTSENSEADRLLLTEDVYVGPVKKKGRRPGNAAASGSGNKLIAEHSEASSSTMVELEERPNTCTTGPSVPPCGTSKVQAQKCKPSKKSPPNTASLPSASTPLIPGPLTFLDVLARFSSSSSSSDPNIQNLAILTALNAIDSTTITDLSAPREKNFNPVLVTALRDLLSAMAQQGPSHPPELTTTSNTLHRSRTPDEDIIILDKENVNPTAFRRRGEKDSKPFPAVLGTVLTSGPSNSEYLTDKRSPAIRPNGNAENRTCPTPANASTNADSRVRPRKRTLSDFMEEREAGKAKGKAREREWAERRDAHRHADSLTKKNEPLTHRHYPRLVTDSLQSSPRRTNSYYRTGMEPWTSPPKSRDDSKGNSNQEPITIFNSPQAPKVSASSPIRSNSSQVQTRRRYIIPTWARTDTSTQPRLSQAAQRALELAEQRQREEKEANKRKATYKSDKEKKRKRIARSTSPTPRQLNSTNTSTNTINKVHGPPPITAASDCQQFSITAVIEDRVAAFSSPSMPLGGKSPRSSADGSVIPPCTPPRRKHSDLFSPDDSSLFTPIPRRRGSSLRGSPNDSGRRRVSLGSLKKNNKTPTPKPVKVAVEDGNEASGEESEDDIDEVLNQELNTALQDLDTSSCLTSASSESETDRGTLPLEHDPIHSKDNTEDSDLDLPKKQHWIGLPPSSPPPPTSPIVMPQDDASDELSDDMQLPVATSDVEPYPTDSEVGNSLSNASACTDDELVGYLSNNGLATLFTTVVDQPIYGSDTAASMDLFDQFTNHNAQSESVSPNPMANIAIDFNVNGLTDFDFTEFWETFKPLLEDQNAGGIGSTTLDLEKDSDAPSLTFDHAKLAEDVQALFSGCLM
ncbi:hypothetical protein H0H81_001685 [Sphagnurus paluster]|uniref:Ams2/SPT21 N-terminal domain-containing protein n=1 Tax=Sphagnurus paluster TaxID=117069 RepID=A0A9P7GMY1_9AGAR|nr:hypothetical protein H0H81_001685 [Sphagnurus paluster]